MLGRIVATCLPSNSALVLFAAAFLVTAAHGQPLAPAAAQSGEDVSLLPADDLSPLFLGMYRKVMEIESDISRYARKYDVDVTLARAVCMYESGGNAGLRSSAGAQGYFQVMPATFRSLRVKTNIEAGIKYLGQLVRRFGRQDLVLAGYNGGPTRVERGRRLPLETRQYVQGVGYYHEVLEKYEPSIRAYARQLGIEKVRPGDDWLRLSQRLDVPLVQLRLYNPFLAARALRTGYQIAYPLDPEPLLFSDDAGMEEDDAEAQADNDLSYRLRLGDNLIKVATVLGANLADFRKANQLEPLESLPPGAIVKIPLSTSAKFTSYRIADGDDLPAIARRFKIDPWIVVRDNHLWDQKLEPGTTLRIRKLPPPPAYTLYTVRRGDTLSSIAARYRTTVRALQQVNSMGGSTRIRIGQRIRIRRT